MKQQTLNFTYKSLLLLCVCSLFIISCAGDGNRPPELFGLEDQRLEVNVNFQLEITAFDKDEDLLTYSYTLTPPPPTETQGRGGVPTLQKVSAYKAIFNWTPGNADIGQYSLSITVQDESQSQSSETITLTVVDSNDNASRGIRFIKPAGNVTILNITDTPCLETEVELQAESLTDSELSVRLQNAPIGSLLDNLGSKRYQLTWCPTQDQLMTQRSFIFELVAENTRGIPPVTKEYVVQIRSQSNEQCLGEAPTIAHVPLQTQRGVLNYQVLATITDDQTITIDPIVAYQFASLSQITPSNDWIFVSMSLHNQANQWIGTIPVNTDPNGIKVFYQIIARDDDDINGIACDHSTESEIYQFDAYWDQSSTQRLGVCDLCVNDIQCGTVDDRCIPSQDELGGLCGQSCDLESSCPDGFQCRNISSVDQVPSYQCVSFDECGSLCESDRYDQMQSNQVATNATLLSLGSHDQLTLCGTDIDFYQVNVPAGQGLRTDLYFDRQEGYLNLDVSFYQDGQEIAVSGQGVSDQQQSLMTPCLSQDQNILVQISSANNPKNTYRLDLNVHDQCDNQCMAD